MYTEDKPIHFKSRVILSFDFEQSWPIVDRRQVEEVVSKRDDEAEESS